MRAEAAVLCAVWVKGDPCLCSALALMRASSPFFVVSCSSARPFSSGKPRSVFAASTKGSIAPSRCSSMEFPGLSASRLTLGARSRKCTVARSLLVWWMVRTSLVLTVATSPIVRCPSSEILFVPTVATFDGLMACSKVNKTGKVLNVA